MDNNLKLFKKLGIQKDIIEQYLEIPLTNEQLDLVKDFCLKISFDRNNLYSQIKEIFETEYELENQSKIVFLQFISIKNDLLDLLLNSEIQKDFIDLDILDCALSSLNNKKYFQITINDVYQLCDRINTFSLDTSETYSILIKIINNTTTLSDEIIKGFKLKPCKQLIFLVIYLLQSEESIKSFISEIDHDNYINKLFIVRACQKLKKSERTFVIDLINAKLSEISAPELDKLELINPYILLLFELFMDDDNAIIIDEIKRIIYEFKNWDPAELLMRIYGAKPEMSSNFASILFMVVKTLDSSKQHGLDYILDSLFSGLPASELNKYYLLVLSLMKKESGNRIYDKIQADIEFYLDGLMTSVLSADEYRKISLKLLKKLLEKNTLDVKMIDEQYYLYLLRCFHCFIMEADFVCKIAINFYLTSTTKTMQDEIYEYIIISISENYFMILKEIVVEIDNPALQQLTAYLNKKEDFMNSALDNPDFKPSIKRMEQYYEKLADQNRKIQEKAAEDSIFRGFFQSQTILYGHKVRSYHLEDNSKIHEQESVMNKMEYSIPIPVRFTYDRSFYISELRTILKGFSND